MDLTDYDVEITKVLPAPPERVYEAFMDPDQFARWYGPDGFSVERSTVELEARVGGRQRFVMVGDADPSMRTSFDGQFIEVTENRMLATTGAWDGIPGQTGQWPGGAPVRLELLNVDDPSAAVNVRYHPIATG
jgi:uncharacterized protein YndB with AHSA1/START domain